MNLGRRALLAGGIAGCSLALPALGAATLTVAPGQSLAQALRQARDGDTIELQAGEHRGQVGVITQRRLTLRGTGGRPVLVADGRSAEGKALLVVRGGEVLIENIEFRGARVADRNGAGIRFETGHLHVLRCAFFDNENGILASNTGDAELTVEDSVFGQAPAATPLPHLLYVGRIARFTLRGSDFSGGRDGHLVKSRARLNHVLYNRLADGPEGRAAYELEFPNGGQALVLGNVIAKGRQSSNPIVLSFGAEGGDGRAQALVMAHNTLVNEGLRPAVFVGLLPAAGPVDAVYVNNLGVGLGVAEIGLADPRRGNFTLPPGALPGSGRGDFRLAPDALLRGRGVAPGHWRGEALQPAAEFDAPAGTLALLPPAAWSPGAFQS